ncbi:MAG TPA: DUF1349 domain-containing protein [Kineosporiaceae bacterium]|nr:DUF1349 domain-containing protein [Kineosporiaceae bacterium]
MGRPLRADAERSVRAILEAAERVLAQDAGASMEQIAEAAGLTRITVHRRFANRQALLEALAVSAERQLIEAIEDARPDSAPVLVALYRVTSNVLRVKSAWRFTLSHGTPHGEAATALWVEIDTHTLELLTRAQREGILASATDLHWARQVYYALLGEAMNMPGPQSNPDALRPDAEEPDALVTLVVDTLLHGTGPRAHPSSRRHHGYYRRAWSDRPNPVDRRINDMLQLPELPFPTTPSPPEAWSRGEQRGALNATALAHTDFYVNPGGPDSADAESMLNAVTLLGRPPEGDFQLSALVTVDFQAQYDAGVLFLWSDDKHWAKLCFEFSPAAEPMVVSVVTVDRSDDANAFVVDDRSVWLRMARVDGVYAYHASTDGKKWQLVRVFSLGDAVAEHTIGFEAQAPTGDGCTVTFDQIHFTQQRLDNIRDGS